MSVHALCYLTLYTIESSSANKQDVACVNTNILLVGMLASTLRRHIDDGSFEQFQQTLLHTFSTHVAGNGGIIRLTRYLVYLINKDNATLG